MRSCEQIRHYCGYMKQKIILVGSGAGLCQGYSGNTHYTIEDISIIRAIPNMTIISPADAGEAVMAFDAAIHHNQSVYIRLTGNLNCPIIYNDNYLYQIGKANIVHEGEDITIFAAGTMVGFALKAIPVIEKNNISVKLIDMHTIKPIDRKIIENSNKSKLYVSIEEHNIYGGLGSAIAEVMTESKDMPILMRLGIKDTFNLAGDYDNLLYQNRLQPLQIAEDIIIKYKNI
jgi:transketolase